MSIGQQAYDREISLIQRAARGDAEAFSTLFDNHHQAVYEYCLWLAGDPDLAEDITQETFIRAHKNLHRLGPPWKIRAWLCRLARNLYIDHYRQHPFVESLDPEAPIAATDTDPEGKIVKAEFSDPVKQALGKLSPNHREALVLREVGGFQYAEIAEVMGTSLDNVKVLIHRARQGFKDNYSLHLLAEEPLPRCDVLADLLDAWHDGEISGEKEAVVKEHIKTCETCQQRRRELAAMLLLLRGLRLPRPPVRLKSQVLRGINGHGGEGQADSPPQVSPAAGGPAAPPRPRSGSGPAAAISAMLFFILIGLGIYIYFFGWGGGDGSGGGEEPAVSAPTEEATPMVGAPPAPGGGDNTSNASMECIDDGVCSTSEDGSCRDCQGGAAQCGVPCPTGVCGGGLACAGGVCWDNGICGEGEPAPVTVEPAACACTCFRWSPASGPPVCLEYRDCNGMKCAP